MMTFRELYSASFVRELLKTIPYQLLSTGELLGVISDKLATVKV